jgi:nucleoside-diphosphate-sugar epimerase
VNDFFATALEDGAAACVGDGENRWSLVHRSDLAVLYRLLVENRARGIFHATDGESPRVRELAAAASEAAGAGGDVRRVSLDDAREEMGPVADAICMDQVIVSPRSRQLGWVPEEAPFLDHPEEVFAEFRAARS